MSTYSKGIFLFCRSVYVGLMCSDIVFNRGLFGAYVLYGHVTAPYKLPYYRIIFLAHQHKACMHQDIKKMKQRIATS